MHSLPRRVFPVALTLLSLASSAAAVDPALLQNLRWRLLGPFRGGRVLAVTGVPREPSHYYFGAVGGGVWESNDAGRTWTPIFDEVASIGAIAVAPSDPKVLYVGTGEADMRTDIAYGQGMYGSRDGGQTWKHLGLADSHQIGAVIVDPRNADRVFVAVLGHAYGPNAERGVYRSEDGGATWTRVLAKDADTGAIDLVFQPGHPDVLFASLWTTRRPPWNIYPPSNGPGSGLYASRDGGSTWTAVHGNGFPDAPGRIGLAFAPSAPQRLYAMVDSKEGGLYRSDDSGVHWARMSGDTRIWQRGWYFGGIAVEPRDPDTVYACNTALYRSQDGGKTFRPLKGSPGGDDYHTLWIDPEAPQRRILGVDQGAVVSHNGGETWSSWYNQPTGQFYHVATDNRFPYWVYGAQQDSGAAGVPSRSSTRDGVNMTQFREVTAGGESGNIAPDPDDPQIVFGGNVDRLDLRSEQTLSVDPTLAYPDENYRTIWTLPLAFSPASPHALYYGRQFLFRTTDRGAHWDRISPDLTRPTLSVPATLDAATVQQSTPYGERRGVIYAIAPSPLARKTVWVGTDDGLIWRTDDDGGHWNDVTPAALTPWSKVGILEASHFELATAYAAIDRHRLDDYAAHIYRTHDGGKIWQQVADGIPDGAFVNAVREDPVRRGLLYAATERGVFVSFDGGDHWQPLQNGLPQSSVRDLVVHGDDLVVATHGRAFWILDDMSALRHMDSVVNERVVLFPPAPAVRLRQAGFTGTPLPQDEPMAANPPNGAILDYALASTARGPVRLRILDSAGAEVRRYASDDPPQGADLTKLQIAPDWVDESAHLGTSAGMHRFVWPLRYAGNAALGNAFQPDDGLWAAPGTYSVELTVDGELRTQPLDVIADPRVEIAPAALAAQFALARRIEARRSEAAKLSESIATFAKTLPPRGGEADARWARLDALSGGGEAPPGKPTAPPSRPSVRSVIADLANLASAVGSADASPSADLIDGFDRAEGTLRKLSADWSAFDRSLPQH
ncbi:MAG: hypothetical protein ABI609_05355 [Acidobacteriota bacterium]